MCAHIVRPQCRLRIGGCSCKVPRDVLIAVSPVARAALASGKCWTLTFGSASPAFEHVREDNVIEAVMGKDCDDKAAAISFLCAATFLKLSDAKEKAIEFLSNTSCEEVMDVVHALLGMGIEVEEIGGVIAARLAEFIQTMWFWTLPPSVIQGVIDSDSFGSAVLPLVKYIGLRYSEAPEEWGPVLANAAMYEMSPAVLSVLMRIPGFDLRLVKEAVSEMLDEYDNTNQVPTPTTLAFEEAEDGTVSGCLGHLAQLSALAVSCTSVESGYNPCEVLGFSDKVVYSSKYGPVDSITFEAIGFRVRPTSYAMKSGPNAGSGGAPVHWKLEASAEGESWVTIHEVVGDMGLLASSTLRTWKLPGVWEPFKFFRITQLEAKSISHKAFILAGFEIFGTIYAQR